MAVGKYDISTKIQIDTRVLDQRANRYLCTVVVTNKHSSPKRLKDLHHRNKFSGVSKFTGESIGNNLVHQFIHPPLNRSKHSTLFSQTKWSRDIEELIELFSVFINKISSFDRIFK